MDKLLFTDFFNKLSNVLPPYWLSKVNLLLESGFSQNDEVQSYKPTFIASVLSEPSSKSDEKIILTCRKLLIVGFILNNWSEFNVLQKNVKVQSSYKAYLERLCLMLTFDDVQLSDIDIFWKELAIARLQFFPVQAGVVEFYSGFGVKQGISFNALQTISFLSILIRFGRKPYYQVHTHTPVLHNFSSEGWINSYCQIAEMLKDNPHINGIMRGSWFFDPKLKKISPRLSYLQDLPLQNGAQTFCIGKDNSGSAISKSKSRFIQMRSYSAA